MRAERAISEHDEASDAPRLRVYARRPAAKGHVVTASDSVGPDGWIEGPPWPARKVDTLAPLAGRTRVAPTRSTYGSDDFGPQWSDDDEDVDGTWVYPVTHSLAEPLALSSDRNVVVEIDCREHDCNAAVHNVFLLVAY